MIINMLFKINILNGSALISNTIKTITITLFYILFYFTFVGI